MTDEDLRDLALQLREEGRATMALRTASDGHAAHIGADRAKRLSEILDHPVAWELTTVGPNVNVVFEWQHERANNVAGV